MGKYYMPTRIIHGENCVYDNRELLKPLGGKALIVTGRSSAANGSLKDVQSALDGIGAKYAVFNTVEENPSVECVEAAADMGRREGCDFVVAIGGGSPLDAGKGAAFLIKNPSKTGYDLYLADPLDAVPIAAVPTTAGTGSEATGVIVLTNHKIKTKLSTIQKVFPTVSFLDGAYMKNMPYEIMASTVLDALSHSVESYLSASASFFSEKAGESVFEEFGKIKDSLLSKSFTTETLNRLLLISCLSGTALAQAGTSLPHYLGYALTYYKGIPHGRATGVLLYEYLASFNNKDKVNVMLSKLGFDSLESFGGYLAKILYISEEITEAELRQYAAEAASKPEKLKSFPEGAALELLEQIYIKSVERYANA